MPRMEEWARMLVLYWDSQTSISIHFQITNGDDICAVKHTDGSGSRIFATFAIAVRSLFGVLTSSCPLFFLFFFGSSMLMAVGTEDSWQCWHLHPQYKLLWDSLIIRLVSSQAWQGQPSRLAMNLSQYSWYGPYLDGVVVTDELWCDDARIASLHCYLGPLGIALRTGQTWD